MNIIDFAPAENNSATQQVSKVGADLIAVLKTFPDKICVLTRKILSRSGLYTDSI